MNAPRSSQALARWLDSAHGRYLLQWEQQRLDAALVDLFGFHALQLGLPQLDALRHNRMPHRWLAADGGEPAAAAAEPPAADDAPRSAPRIALHCDGEALPFASHSLDLVVLPHALELAADPHRTLREVERVLVPEGRVAIVGFNPASLWGLRQRAGLWCRRLGAVGDTYLPHGGEAIGYRRLRDWLRLLSFEVEGGGFGCYRLPVRSERWLERSAWMDKSGDRWWPVFGAVYLLVAVKRVRGMRIVGLARKEARPAPAAPAVATQRREPCETN